MFFSQKQNTLGSTLIQVKVLGPGLSEASACPSL